MCQHVMTATKRTAHNFCWQTKKESRGIELKPITHLRLKSPSSDGASLNHKGSILRCSGITGCSEVHSEIVIKVPPGGEPGISHLRSPSKASPPTTIMTPICTLNRSIWEIKQSLSPAPGLQLRAFGLKTTRASNSSKESRT